MNAFKKIYCRTFQSVLHAALPFLPYREPKILENTQDISYHIKKLGLDSALIVTDEFLRKSDITAILEQSLKENNINCAIYDKTKPNPTVHNVEEAFSLYKQEKCSCIIAFGGGSSMDCAKAVGVRVVYPKKPLNKLAGILKVVKKLPPLFAIPTTAGTGSEVTLAAVITDSEKKHKYTINSFPLIPSFAVLDASVTYTLPKGLTATTGMDALTHAVEAYIGNSTSRETRKLAEEAVKLIFENIETAYNDGHNEIARRNMLRAAYAAGISFSKSYVGYIHAVAHSLGGQYNIPHGLANSVLLTVVLEEYGSTIYKKLHSLAVVAGLAKESDTHETAAIAFISSIKSLNKRMGIPEKLSGIDEKDIPQMAKHADKEDNPLYPVPILMNAKELEKFYYKIADWS